MTDSSQIYSNLDEYGLILLLIGEPTLWFECLEQLDIHTVGVLASFPVVENVCSINTYLVL